MRTMLHAALLATCATAAQAGTITQTSGPLAALNLAGGDQTKDVDLPLFNQALGTLQSVSIVLNGSLSFVVTDTTGQLQPPTQVPASVSVGVLAPENFGVSQSVLSVTSNGQVARGGEAFTTTYVAANARDFLANNFFILSPNVFVRSLAGPETDSSTDLFYSITETFTYASVPEPGSAALLAGAVLGALCRRQGKQFFFAKKNQNTLIH